ncbi:MAG TPA: serine/threonine-protein kinase [Pirellulaceae bacterium]|nr:serine/threonine-protein kinase [Pirellulaceae bacterium]
MNDSLSPSPALDPLSGRCPTVAELDAFANSLVDERTADSILDHLARCSECESTMVRLERDAATRMTFAGRSPLNDTRFEDESECRRLVERVAGELPGRTTPSVDPIGSTDDAGLDHDEATSVIDLSRTVRDYRIVEKIGQGGMGAVFRAIHTRLDRVVAFKALPSTRLSDPQAVARFEREMRAVGRLDHPHIVRAMDAGEHDGEHYLAMEFVSGSDLSRVSRRLGPLPVADACEMIRQAALGLQHAHEHGLVHRDIKPGNLMLSDGGIVKILDLGLAMLSEGEATDQPELTMTGQVMGTVSYMAPEQGSGTGPVDIRADIYALGATLFKLLTGSAPFEGAAYATPLKRLMALANEPAPDLRTRRDGIPEPLAALVAQLLDKSPEGRPAEPREVAERLRPFVAGADLRQVIARATDRSVDQLPPPDASIGLGLSTPPNVAANGGHDETVVETRGVRPLVSPRTGERPAPSLANRSALPALSSRRRVPILVALAVLGLGGLIYLGIVMSIRTPKGVIDIEVADEAIDQVAIAVERGGRQVSIADKENGWELRVDEGEFRVALVEGAERFELDRDSVSVERDGRAIVRVRRRADDAPEAIAAVPAPDETVMPDRDPAHDVSDPTSPQDDPNDVDPRPFRVVRADGTSESYMGFWAAIENTNDGEFVEVLRNGPVDLPFDPSVDRPVRVRAAAGFRPLLVISSEHGSVLHQGVEFVDCDLDLRSARLYGYSGAERNDPPWIFDRCRIRGAIAEGIETLIIRDSILVTESIFYVPNRGLGSRIELDRCALKSHSSGFYFAEGSHEIVLRNCSWHSRSHGSLDLVRIDPGASVSIQAEGTLLAVDRILPDMFDDAARPGISWRGSGNVAAGYPPLDAEGKDDLTFADDPMRSITPFARLVPLDGPVRFEFIAIGMRDSDVRVASLERFVATLREADPTFDAGPNFAAVGAGAAYERGRDASGEQDEPHRPERLDGGAFLVTTGNGPPRPFRSLQEACEAAKDGDVIEIRSDADFGSVTISGDRSVTIRAARGYLPHGKRIDVVGRGVTFEGLTFEYLDTNLFDEESPSTRADAVRVMNCTVGVVNGRATERRSIEIGNSLTVIIGVTTSTGGHLTLTNSVADLVMAPADEGAPNGDVRIERSLLWNPQGIDRGALVFHASQKVMLERSLFVGGHQVLQGINGAIDYAGNGNVYCAPGGVSTLGGYPSRPLRLVGSAIATDVDPKEGLPVDMIPSGWRLPEELTARLPEGTSVGVSIETLSERLGEREPVFRRE